MDSARSFAPLPGNQLQVITVSLLREILLSVSPMADTSPQALMNSAACLACLNPGQLAIIQTQLLCDLVTAINNISVGSSCVSCSALDPVAVPAGCTCAFHVNTATSSLWYWNAGTATWLSLIV